MPVATPCQGNREYEILGLWQDSVSVGEMDRESGQTIVFPVEDVLGVQERCQDQAATAGLIVVGAGLGVLVVAAVLASTQDWMGGQ